MSPLRPPALRVGLAATSFALLLLLPGVMRAEVPAPIEPLVPAAPLARLLSPAAGARAVPGELVAIAWEPAAGLAALSHVEEWEAFLSLDGGATYPLRITPHLDAGRRHFLWRVPNLPAARARLLLRFGDERREVGMEAPATFTITAARSTGWEPPPFRALRRGEVARPGDAGVIGWVEGPRDGTWQRPVAAAAQAPGLRSAGGARLLPFFAAWPAPGRALLLPPAGAVAPADRRVPAPDRPAAPSSSASSDVRLLIHRFNE